MSPVIESKTKKKILEGLDRAGIADTPASSVLRTLETVLGSGDKSATHAYRENPEHLPFVDGKSVRLEDGRMEAELTAWLRNGQGQRAFLRGTFSRTANSLNYEWESHDVSVQGLFTDVTHD